ncbi:MAG TPA: hypothetical protein VK116_13910 [Planctomycetota bacterium]|nr:hypothetical protein [Planctomycetota bacterium]
MRILASLFGPLFVMAFASSLALADDVEPPAFSFRFEPASLRFEGPPGATHQMEALLILSTGESALGLGAQAWTMSIVADGVELTSISLDGTVAASFDDDPPGLRQKTGFARAELRYTAPECDEFPHATTTVALSLANPRVTLPPDGDAIVGQIELHGAFPEELGATRTATLSFSDACIGSETDAANVVLFNGLVVEPETDELVISLVSKHPEFRRGDSNGDSGIDLSDALFSLGCQFLGGNCPSCLDAAYANDDGVFDLTDAIVTLTFLFSGSVQIPSPGPHACGVDPTNDDMLPVCRQDACSSEGE